MGAGFASIVVAILTFFRYAPATLFYLSWSMHRDSKGYDVFFFVMMVVVIWEAFIIFLLIIAGLLLLLSMKIRKCGVLLLHPWALLFLYLDVAVWIGLGIFIHFKTYKNKSTVTNVTDYMIPFYVDTAVFFIFYYVYATYFIVAELTVIENFYPHLGNPVPPEEPQRKRPWWRKKR